MKHEEIFERLDPPRGGLAKLRGRLDERPSNVRRLVFATALAAAAAALVFVAWPRSPDFVAAARASGGIDQVSLGLASPKRAVAVADSRRSAAVNVKTTNPDVVFVWVSSTQ